MAQAFVTDLYSIVRHSWNGRSQDKRFLIDDKKQETETARDIPILCHLLRHYVMTSQSWKASYVLNNLLKPITVRHMKNQMNCSIIDYRSIHGALVHAEGVLLDISLLGGFRQIIGC